jgi:hypothetical protein
LVIESRDFRRRQRCWRNCPKRNESCYVYVLKCGPIAPDTRVGFVAKLSHPSLKSHPSPPFRFGEGANQGKPDHERG